MDVTVSWTKNSDPESFIDSLKNTRSELTKCCFSKYGAGKIIKYDVYACKSICSFLMSLKHESPAEDEITNCSQLLAEFPDFRLHSYTQVDENKVRVQARFDVGDKIIRLWYGNIFVI